MRPKLQHEREAEILELSGDVANEDSSSGRVSPTRICKEKGIEIVHNHYGRDKFDGMLVLRDGRWVILCNLDTGNISGSTRERFTLAHELGHYHIPEHRRQLLAGCRSHGSYAGAFDGAGSVEELEADTFAANLLMPGERFLPALAKKQTSPLATIAALRVEFDTSLEATAIQAMRHDPRIVVMAKWNSAGFDWHRISDQAFKLCGYRVFRLQEKSVLAPDGATACALGDPDAGLEQKIHSTVVTAAHCFDWVGAGGKRDILFREEAVKNGRFGVLAVYSEYEVAQSRGGHR